MNAHYMVALITMPILWDETDLSVRAKVPYVDAEQDWEKMVIYRHRRWFVCLSVSLLVR